MDRGAWWATFHRLVESDMTEATYHVRPYSFIWLTPISSSKTPPNITSSEKPSLIHPQADAELRRMYDSLLALVEHNPSPSPRTPFGTFVHPQGLVLL